MNQYKGVHKLGLGTLSVFLSILMIVYLIPLSVYADLASSLGDGSEEFDMTASIEQPEQITEESPTPDAMFELTDRREQNVKHFRLSDGSIVAAQYATSIHEQDENGEWQDIDNTLGDSGNEYATPNARVKFAKKITGNENLFTLHDGKYKITMSLDGAIKKTPGTVTNTQTEFDEDATQLQKMMTLDKLSAKIMYADILDGVDLEYVLNSVNVKENIIVKQKKDSYTYTFTLDLNNLTAALQPDGSIHISDPDSGEVKYRMPAPIVYDAAGITADSSLSAYTLTQTGNHTYTLAVTVNADWMNAEDRAFPVTVDPSIGIAASNDIDLFISQSNPNASFETLTVNNVSAGITTYWRSNTLPTIPASAYITQATISMKTASTVIGKVGVYQVTENWSSDLTWNTANTTSAGSISPALLDYVAVDTATGVWKTWDITSLVKKWYSDTANYGVAFKPVTNVNNTYSFHSANAVISSTPRFSITYRDMKGMESYWSSTSHSAGLAGSGSVNTATGNLTFAIGTLTTTDALFAYTPTLVYNSANANLYNTNTYNSNIPYKYLSTGYGLKLNYQETIMPVTLTDETGSTTEYYVWSDSDGTEHYFYDNDSDGVFNDEDGLQLTLILTQDNNGEKYLIEDTVSKTARTFKIYLSSTNIMPRGGALESITDKYGNKLVFTLNERAQPTKISVQPVGQTAIDFLTLSYNSINVLYEIKNETSGQKVTLHYGISYTSGESDITISYGGPLRKVIYSHKSGSSWVNDAIMEYTYTAGADNVYRLASAKDTLSDVSIVYTYDEAGKIASVQEYGGTTAGQQISYTYGTDYTEIRNSGSDDVHGNTDDLITHYSFDHQGRAVSVYTTDTARSTIYGASSGEYESNNENAKNSLKTNATVGGETANCIFNGGFELLNSTNTSPLGWSVTGSPSFTADLWELNGNSAVIDNESSERVTLSQSVKLPKGDYTLSMDIGMELTTHGNVTLQVIAANNTTEMYEDIVEISHIDNSEKFHRTATVNFSVDIESGTKQYQVVITVNRQEADGGTITIDNVALEHHVGIGSYSMLNFGSFESTSPLYSVNTYWTGLSGTDFEFIDIQEEPFRTALRIDGLLDENSYVTQTIPVVSPGVYDLAEQYYAHTLPIYQPRSFILSGFAKGSEQVANEDASFSLDLWVYYHDGSMDLHEVFFNKDLTEWQFASGSFTSDADKVIEYMEVDCNYTNQPGTAYFDNISLVEVQGGEVSQYFYDPEDDSGLPTIYYTPSYSEYYEYDEDNNLTLKLTSDFMMHEYSYNDTGALETEIVSKYRYNDLTQAYQRQEWYDVRHYNPNTPNITSSVICTTTHTINDYGLETATTVKGTETLPLMSSASYELTEGSKIFGKCISQTNTDGVTTNYVYNTENGLLKYSECEYQGLFYTYDAMHRVSGVYPLLYYGTFFDQQNNAEQAKYTYDTQGRVQSIKTGTTTYTYEYDDFGNTTSISVGDDLLVSYLYTPSNGKLKSMTYANGTVVTYFYDTLDRMSKVCYTVGTDSVQEYVYTYTVDGAIKSVESTMGGRGYEYTYDTKGQMIGYAEYDTGAQRSLLQVVYLYNSRQQLDTAEIAFSYTAGGTAQSDMVYSYYEYEPYVEVPDADSADSGDILSETALLYDADGGDMLSEMHLDGAGGNTEVDITYAYDALYRMTEKVKEWNNSLTMREAYTFADKTSKATTRVGSFTSTVGTTSSSYVYSYDSFGNIETISIPISEDEQETIIRYYYDDQQQLVRENNKLLNKTYTYTYDRGGNRTSLTAYPYTTGSLSGVTGTVILHTYEGDRLTAISSAAITYDEIGNPLTYGTTEFTWRNGRQLATFTKGSTSVSYKYNDSGIRTSKTVNGIEHIYTLNGSQIVTESWTQNNVEYVIVYLYDESGAPIGMQYRTSNYAWGEFDNFFFEKNLFGDIVAVYNESGTKVITYTYDAWGNHTPNVLNSTGNNAYASYNPFRYRGYYYDTETGFYYLQSRYYNPQWGRFLNADGYVNANGDLIGFNMYAYCSNNPVMSIDPFGTFSLKETWNNVTTWVDDNIINPAGQVVVETTFAIIDWINPNNEISSVQIGYTVSAGCGFGIAVSYGITLNRNGDIAPYITPSAGGSAGVGISVSPFVTFSTAEALTDIEGLGFDLGGSFSIPIYGPIGAGGGYDFSISPAARAHTISANVGAGLLPVEFHAYLTYTIQFKGNNIYE